MVHGVERALAMKQIADAKRLGEITQIATTPVNLDDSIFSESKRVLDNN
jgi:phosphate-selective porin